MSMSEGGNEGLFKLAESAAPDPNRLMPTERTYVKTSKTLDLSEAVSLMKGRRQKKLPVISGGLDDPSASLRKQAEEPSEKPQNPQNEQSGPQSDDSGEKGAAMARRNGRRWRNASSEDLSSVLSAVSSIGREIEEIRKGMSETENAQPSDQDDLSAFKSGRHRVTFRLKDMSFEVTCLGMIRDASTHTLVLAFSSDTDAFFTPPMKSELAIRYDGSDVSGSLFYFGMSFQVKELGLRFLGFLYDDGTRAESGD